MSLVIPMIPSELDRPALAGILAELCHVSYLDSLVVSLNKATLEDYERTRRYFEPYRRPRWSSSGANRRP